MQWTEARFTAYARFVIEEEFARFFLGNTTISLTPAPTRQTWARILAGAYALFDDLERKGFPAPPFSLGGGTVSMFRFQHRLSKGIDFVGYDAQWLSLLSPRLNETAAAMATS